MTTPVPSEQTLVIEYYLKQITKHLATLVGVERQGFRVRAAKKQSRKIQRIEVEEGIQLLCRRLDQAPEGMTMKEMAAFMHEAGWEKFAKNMVKYNHAGRNPITDMIKNKLVIVTRDQVAQGGKFAGPRRFWTRSWYLRKFASLPDDWQQAEVEEALNPVDESNNDD